VQAGTLLSKGFLRHFHTSVSHSPLTMVQRTMAMSRFRDRKDVLIIFSRLTAQTLDDLREHLYTLKVVSHMAVRRDQHAQQCARAADEPRCAYVTVHCVRDAARVLSHFASLPQFSGAIGRSRSIYVSPPSWQCLTDEEKHVLASACISPIASMKLARAQASCSKHASPSCDEPTVTNSRLGVVKDTSDDDYQQLHDVAMGTYYYLFGRAAS
jgi:hypothetical protein